MRAISRSRTTLGGIAGSEAINEISQQHMASLDGAAAEFFRSDILTFGFIASNVSERFWAMLSNSRSDHAVLRTPSKNARTFCSSAASCGAAKRYATTAEEA